MARKICILSGKGGVGKSTITANLGFALAKQCKRVLLVDLDFGLNSLDLLLSCQDNIVFDIADVVNKKCRFRQALVADAKMPNLYCLISGSFAPTKSNFYNFSSLIKREQNAFDYILFDCGAGVNETLDFALKLTDEVLTVVTPHFVCIKDAQAVVEYAKKFSPIKIYAIANRVRGDLVKSGFQMSAHEVFARLGLTPLGIVPEVDALNGFCRKESKFFDVLADNLINGKQTMYNYLKEYNGLFAKLRFKLKRNA